MSGSSSCAICSEFKSTSFKQLVLWEKPRVTGIVVGFIGLLLLIFGLFEYTLVTFLCRLLEVAIAIVGVLVYQKTIDISVDEVKRRTRAAISDVEPHVIHVMEVLFRIVSWEDNMVSLKVFLGSLVVAFLGNILSDLAFVLLAAVCVFVLPAAYVHNKTVIDPHLNRASKVLDQYVGGLRPKTE